MKRDPHASSPRERRPLAVVLGLGFVLAAGAVVGWAAWGRRTPPPEKVVVATEVAPDTDTLARVGDVVVTVREFGQLWAKRAPGGDPARAKQELLDELIRRKLLYAEATRIGFDRRPEIQAAWSEFVASRFAEDRATAREGLPPPTAEELQARYQARLASLTTPERAHAALVFLPLNSGASADAALALRAKADAIREQAVARARDDADFGKLALEHSEHRGTRRRGGDIGWVTRSTLTWPAEVRDAVFALSSPGEISPVIRTSHGLYLVKLMERQGARPRPFDEVRAQLEYEFKRQRAGDTEEAFYAELRSRHAVTVREDRLAEIPGPAPRSATTPPQLVAR